ncbi:MAG: hypothetical protein K2H22_06820, partial [Muribaculaceae bacterium]|nr:hypothetical protein [Muribaculaceae bacterium]
MKRQTLVKGLMCLTVVSMLTGCVDDKYDLSDIDTTSRFTVNDLTVPVNLSEIKLENVINLDDNDNVEKIVINGRDCYAIVKNGSIDPTEFSLGGIHVASPELKPSLFSMDIRSDVNVPGMDVAIPFPKIDLQDYNFNMHDVDRSLQVLRDVKTNDPIKVEVTLSIPHHLTAGNNIFSFQNLKIQLPKDLITKAEGYDKTSGVWIVKE